MCAVLLPPGVNPIAVNRYIIISYHNGEYTVVDLRFPTTDIAPTYVTKFTSCSCQCCMLVMAVMAVRFYFNRNFGCNLNPLTHTFINYMSKFSFNNLSFFFKL